MCRLFCRLSVKEGLIYNDVFKSRYSLLRQADEEGHNDGWGAYSYDGSKLSALAKSTKPLRESEETASAAVRAMAAKCSGFFIRDASNPLGLERDKILTIEATQPFTYMNMTFMHNGVVRSPDKIMEAAKGFGTLPASKNDSEVYAIAFWHFFKSGNAGGAFRDAEKFISEGYASSGSEGKAFSSLNAIVTDGERIYAFNRYTKEIRKGLSNPSRDFYEMSFSATDSEIRISSEPTDDAAWENLGNGKMLEAWIEGGRMKYELKSIEVIEAPG